MGFFDEIKKVLFGAKAVTKSAVGKVAEKGREAADKSGDFSITFSLSFSWLPGRSFCPIIPLSFITKAYSKAKTSGKF